MDETHAPDLEAPCATGVSAVQRLVADIRENVGRVIVGGAETVDLLLVALLCRGHVLIEDVPGTGKTTLAKAIAASLDCRFQRIQFTTDLVPADVTGVNFYDARSGRFEFRPGPVFTQILLADEINRATPRTQSALLEAMKEHQVSVDGETHALPQPFIVLATLNPVEMEGTFPLPEAQLDRFLMRVSLGYPRIEEEAAMLDRFRGGTVPANRAPVAGPAEVMAAQAAIAAVQVAPPVRDYLLAIIHGTRRSDRLRLGASPRAALALQTAAQAMAAMDGRAYVMPDDVKRLSVPVLAHRVITDAAADLRGTNAAQVVAGVVEATPVPIEG